MIVTYAYPSAPRSLAGDAPPTVTETVVPVASGILPTALNAGAGYLVGKLLGYPLAGAVATGAFGMLGMLGVAIYAVHNDKGGK